MTSYTIKLDDESEEYLSVLLIRNVNNTGEIRKMLMKGDLNCCVINPALIIHPFQVAVAANIAALSRKQGKLSTRTVYSEILYNLSATKNISQSLKLFGIDDSYKNILIAVFEKDKSGNEIKSLLSNFSGEVLPVDMLSEITDTLQIKHHYNINEDELSSSSLLESVVTRISTKGVL